MTDDLRPAPRAFSLTDGGPFYHLVVRLRLLRRGGVVRSWSIALALWTPLLVGSAIRGVLHMPPDGTVLDLSVHARILVTLPLLLVSERLLDAVCRGAISSLYEGNFCERAALDRIVDRGEMLRDAWWAEAILFALAVAGGQLALWQVIGATGVIHGGTVSAWSFPHVWYASVALPIVQFLMFRWLWRWLIWTYMLARIARLPLAALATHPDHAAGLAPLAWPVTGFGGFVLGVGAVLSSAWATQLYAHRATITSLLPGLLVFMLLAIVVAFGPLLLFSGHLYRARRQALYDYSDFARRYTRRFHAKWIGRRSSSEQALGSPDIQALNDLGGSFQVIEKTQWFVFGPRKVFDLWLAALIPMLPLIASTVTVEQVVKRILGTVLGGLPL